MSRTCEYLLEKFKKENMENKFLTDKIKFVGVEGFDVYNITAPIKIGGERIIAGRVEKRESEHAQIKFFKEQKDGQWYLIENTPVLNLQDPFFSFIDEELILGGVEVFDNPSKPGTLWYKTIFLKGKDIFSLEKFSEGPNGMKDIRICRIRNNKIAVFSRPQGELGGRGTIGFLVISTLDELTSENILKAKLLTKQFVSQEWGGGNEIHLLKNGKLGVLSHIASFDLEGGRHYYPTVFTFNPENFEYSELELIGYRKLFKEGVSKRKDLEDVVFSGGIERLSNGKAKLYAGIGDAEAHWIEINDPFTKYEN